MTELSKIQQIEEMLSHQANSIEELNEVVTKQWKAIDFLEKRSAALVERLLALEEVSEGTIENTKPPHY